MKIHASLDWQWHHVLRGELESNGDITFYDFPHWHRIDMYFCHIVQSVLVPDGGY